MDDAESCRRFDRRAVPVLGNRVFQEFQNCSLELPEGFVVPVMGRVLVHESPTLFVRTEMGTKPSLKGIKERTIVSRDTVDYHE